VNNMSDNNEEQPRYIDPNSGAAPQPGGFVASVLPQETAGEDAGEARPDNDPQAAERAEGTEQGNTPDAPAGQPAGDAGADGADGTEDAPTGDSTEEQTEEQAEETEAQAKDYSELLSGGVKDVQDYLKEHPEEKDAVIAAEKQGQNRKTLVES
jgi:hypothetical protein